MEYHDKVFAKNFAIIIAALMVFTLFIALLANIFHGQVIADEDPMREDTVAARTAPVGGVFAGEAGAAALAAAQEAAAATMAANVAFDGSLDGAMIYGAVCGTCHDAGLAGAPRLVAGEWVDRNAQGLDVMVQHAIEGFQGNLGYMPPKGGRADLSDEQVRVTVEYMVAQAQ